MKWCSSLCFVFVSPSGNPVQQIGLSVPVIIIKQEEACQCQCACRDSAKDKATSTVKKECSSPDSKALEQPASQLQPQTFPSSSAPPSCGQRSQIVNPSDSQTETLSAMDVSDFLSLQSPETPSNIIPIEALLQGEEEIGLNSSFSKWRCSRFFLCTWRVKPFSLEAETEGLIFIPSSLEVLWLISASRMSS